jgi:DNA-binding NtrC family response regulator
MAPKKVKSAHNAKPTVMIVDDQNRTFRSLQRLIPPESFTTIWVYGEQEGLAVLQDQPSKVSIVLMDLKTSQTDGGGFFLQRARQLAPQAAVLMTHPLGPFLFQGGNFYEFSGPSLKRDIEGILLSINEALTNGQVSRNNGSVRVARKERFGTIIGRSQRINAIYKLIDQLKDSNCSVLIQGESGTGKELIAQTLHQTSQRGKGPFVAINCGAIPANLVESELFGHERGAFTTAISQRKGKFELANSGTLFLDEVGELDLEMQVKLLRVLQEKEFQRVGGNQTYRADARIIAATSRDLKLAVQQGHFRDDLFYRLNVMLISIPPLRDRREDIPLLLQHFFTKVAEEMGLDEPLLTEATEKALMGYHYPGNVRELINIVERLLIVSSEGKITLKDIPRDIRSETSPESAATGVLNDLPEGGVSMHAIEKELILKTLELAHGNKTAAARMLGITRRRLYLRLSQYASESA